MSDPEDMRRALEQAKHALEMIRDADEDCRKDGLQTMPEPARRRIREALSNIDQALI